MITLDTGVYALLALTIVLVWPDSALDREAVWERLDHDDRSPTRLPAAPSGRCRRLRDLRPGQHAARRPSALPALRRRRCTTASQTASQRTWALVIAAAMLYVPANYYPVLTVVQLGAGAASTILGGVEELIDPRMYPLAALVFFASIAVPMLKLVGLSIMLRDNADRPVGMAARPHAALPRRALDRPLVDDRHLHGSRCSARW